MKKNQLKSTELGNWLGVGGKVNRYRNNQW